MVLLVLLVFSRGFTRFQTPGVPKESPEYGYAEEITGRVCPVVSKTGYDQ